MLTIFTVPRSFNRQYGLIQRNAILSWLNLKPACEIILLGDDEGVDEIAKELNIKHIRRIKKNEFGTPLINDIFEKAQELSKNNILVYVNSDIILTGDFIKIINTVKKDNFLLVGRRWDLNIEELINLKEAGWQDKLVKRVNKDGKLHGPAGIDYFVFPKGLWNNIPALALGRTAWDNWFLYEAQIKGATLIDATQAILVIHQNHSYNNHHKGKNGVWKGKEAERNLELAGGYGHLFTIRDADFIINKAGELKRPKITAYRFFSFPFRNYEKNNLFKPFLFWGWLVMIVWRKIQRLF